MNMLFQQPDLAAWLAIWRAPDLGSRRFFALLTAFPDLREVFTVNASCLEREFKLSSTTITHLKNPDWRAVEDELAWAKIPSHHIIKWTDEAYPPLLREISTSPPLLYVMGDLQALHAPQLAIVGSRNPTPVGLENAYRFAKELAEMGLTITSGLALGIDAACHQGALAGQGQTVAVMGTGLKTIYPRRHRDLAEQIIQQGALVSEFPLEKSARAEHFPQRNRLISGLSSGVLVVEAACSSGSLITARYANEQGREVFAIPGSIHNPLAHGCHALIREGAKLVETVADILEEIKGLLQGVLPNEIAPPKNNVSKNNLNALEARLVAAVDTDVTPFEVIIQRTGLTAAQVSSILLPLELQGRVSLAPGGYQRNPPKS